MFQAISQTNDMWCLLKPTSHVCPYVYIDVCQLNNVHVSSYKKTLNTPQNTMNKESRFLYDPENTVSLVKTFVA